MPYRNALLVVLMLATLGSCATLPPTLDKIHQDVTEFLGTPAVPPVAHPSVAVEPLGLRWTLVRNQVMVRDVSASGATSNVLTPTADALLGVELGQGLFLDTQGNLSFLPLRQWAAVLPAAGRYQAQITPDLWSHGVQSPIDFEVSATGYRVYNHSLFGISTTDINTTKYPILALGKKVGQGDDGGLWETNAFQMLEPIQRVVPVGNGVKRVTQTFLGTSNNLFQASSTGVDSADANFSVQLEDDHWRITLGKDQWLLFSASTKAYLVNVRTGEWATMVADPTGATLTSSAGNHESLLVGTGK